MRKVIQLYLIFSIGCFFILPSSVLSGGMTIDDLFQLRSIKSAVVSPDGGSIAYTVSIPRVPFVDEGGSNFQELYLTNSASQSKLLLGRTVKFSAVTFSPDGGSLFYLAKRDDDEKKSLYQLPLSGGESVKILEFETGISSYVISPDRNTVAFIAQDTLDTKRKKYQDEGFTQEVFEEDYRFSKVWLYQIGGENDPAALDIDGHPTNLKYSPDGEYLSMMLAPTPLIDDSYTSRKLTVVESSGGAIVKQFDSEGKLGAHIWSPDSKNIAVIKSVDKNDPREGRFYRANLKDGKYHPVLVEYDGHIRDVKWLDNKTLLYLGNTHVESEVATINSDGSDNKILIPQGGVAFYRFYLSNNKKVLALIGENSSHPGELYKYEFTKEPTRLTVSNDWFNDIELAEQEVVFFNARDSLEIEGILIHPLNEVPGKKYPLIMAVHGGPESNHTNGWMTGYSYPGQIAAARGFAIFYTNYRGSTGRGVAFSKLGQADYAGGEFNDLVDAVEYLVGTGLVDRDKVGITGRSYGGYASAWGATGLSKHFAASVMGVGISDLISKFGTTDIPQEMLDVHALREPWDYWQWYLERSPIYHAANSSTPILIIHNSGDTRVHPSQSMELYRFMKYQSKAPVRMVLYKGEKHGSSKMATKYDYLMRLMRWMEHYLIGEEGQPPPYEIDYPGLNPDDK